MDAVLDIVALASFTRPAEDNGCVKPLDNKAQQHGGKWKSEISERGCRPAMLRPLLRPAARPQLLRSLPRRPPPLSRPIFSLFRRSKPAPPTEPVPILSQDNLFHPFSKSPFPAVRARGEAIKKLALCPKCDSHHPKPVQHECPDCGWPTHCSEEHWKHDEEHQKYCSRLREANEDEHDLRSGRRMTEFELPGT